MQRWNCKRNLCIPIFSSYKIRRKLNCSQYKIRSKCVILGSKFPSYLIKGVSSWAPFDLSYDSGYLVRRPWNKGFLFGHIFVQASFFVSWTCDGLLFYVLSIKVCTISTSHKTLQKPPAFRERRNWRAKKYFQFDWLLCLGLSLFQNQPYHKSSHG